MYKCALILAAGEGKRMKSEIPKVLHKICGKEMVNCVIDSVRASGIEDVNIVVGKKAEQVKKGTQSRKVSYSIQEQQLGTGHAVLSAKEFLKDKKGTVAIFTGDAPLIKGETIEKLIEFHNNEEYAATILTSMIDEPTGYGRLIRDENGEALKIVEHKDCNEVEILTKEINSGMYCFDIKNLLESLDKIKNDNSQQEYYLTDVIGILKNEGKKIGALKVPYEETKGINSRYELSQGESILRQRILKQHMENGVRVIDPMNTYIDIDVIIGEDTTVYPGNVLEMGTEIGSESILYPNSRIVNSKIGNNVNIQSSVIIDSSVGNNTTVGPFAYIRPESIIGDDARIGDFVEIKKSTIGNKTKVSHLTYIGDAEVGEGCNFGCGTVVVNYDGKTKHKTIIGNNSFIGCNTNLVSPVTVKDNTYIAAGSTITYEVPEGALAIARARQVNIKDWVIKKALKK
ncbi:MAG: bifunctional UDP-N-acetylglucosamine diphosphorylase/glucosamine-1-phosphate N-acetyltransferase GlmU [Clostridiaceae bacterium]